MYDENNGDVAAGSRSPWTSCRLKDEAGLPPFLPCHPSIVLRASGGICLQSAEGGAPDFHEPTSGVAGADDRNAADVTNDHRRGVSSGIQPTSYMVTLPAHVQTQI